jgi:drug/metabolite transporter (DMT)-like permease
LKFHWDRHTVCGLCAILIWSTTVSLARSIAEQVGPLTAASAVHLVAGAFCLGYQVFRPRGSFRQVFHLPPRYLFGCGAFFVFYMLALFLALGHASDRRQVLEVALLNYLWPALTILFSLPLLNKKAGLALIPGTLLALLGVFLVLTQGHSFSLASLWGHVATRPSVYVLGVAAAVSWALYSNLTRLWAGARSGGGVALFLPATGLILLLLRLCEAEGGFWTLRAGLEVLFMGLSTAIAYVLWDLAMRKGNIVFIAACSYLTSFLSTLLSCIYLQVSAGAALWLGCFFIVAGSFLSWTSVSEKDSPVPLDDAG